MVVSGHIHTAGISRTDSEDRRDLSDLRRRAASLEDEFLGDASRVVDDVIERLSNANTRWWTRTRYDLMFCAYVVFLIARIGYNFFWQSFLGPATGLADEKDLFTVDFYAPAILFFVLWSGLLVMMFSWKLRRGLNRHVTRFAESMAESKLLHGLFPDLEQTCSDIQRDNSGRLLWRPRTADRPTAPSLSSCSLRARAPRNRLRCQSA